MIIILKSQNISLSGTEDGAHHAISCGATISGQDQSRLYAKWAGTSGLWNIDWLDIRIDLIDL